MGSKWKIYAVVAALLLLGTVLVVRWAPWQSKGPGPGFVSGNGRIEAVEVDVATKLGGRVKDILVREGDFVQAGQVLGHMQVYTLQAQRDEAAARQQQSVSGVDSAQAQVAVRQCDIAAAEGVVAMRESEVDAAQRRLRRSDTLAKEGASSAQELDDDRARVRSAQAAVAATKAQTAAAQAAIAAG